MCFRVNQSKRYCTLNLMQNRKNILRDILQGIIHVYDIILKNPCKWRFLDPSQLHALFLCARCEYNQIVQTIEIRHKECLQWTQTYRLAVGSESPRFLLLVVHDMSVQENAPDHTAFLPLLYMWYKLGVCKGRKIQV